MARTFKLCLPLFTLVAMLTSVSMTRADKETFTLDGVDLGTYVYGPKITSDALAGKVVMIEYWGDQCGPCIQAIPHTVELQGKYASDKLVVIANQVWTQDVNVAKAAWTKAGGNDKISVINHGNIKGAQVNAVPQTFVFDHNGKMIWTGHPMHPKLEEIIEKAVAALPNQG